MTTVDQPATSVVKNGDAVVAVTVPEYPAETTVQPDVPPVPLVPGTVPVVPAGHVTATEGGRER